MTVIENTDVRAFDDALQIKTNTWSLHFTHEELFQGDWARGPAGTNEVAWGGNFTGIENYTKTGVGEPWELDPSTNSIIFSIRKGVYFHDKPPVNGREMTADDVVASINRVWATPVSFLHNAFPAPIKVEKTGPWEVTAQFETWAALTQTIVQIGNLLFIWPVELIEKYPNFNDWTVHVGTGPFQMTDYVKDSSMRFVKFDNYWDTDPVGPGKGNQLPYLDGVKILIIPDSSTRMAAMRTGKADQGVFTWEESASLKQTTPALLDAQCFYTSPFIIALRMDNPELPWYKLEVRQAMARAINYQEIVDTYYGGIGNWNSYPTYPQMESKDFRLEFEDWPADVQDIYTYNPDKAKKMLADAGYQNGFDLEVVCTVADADLMSIYKDYLAKVGVNLIIDSKEPAVYNGIRTANSQKHSIFRTSISTWAFNMDAVRWPCAFNASQIIDEYCNQVFEQVWAEYSNWDKRCAILKEYTPYVLRQAWLIQAPVYPSFVVYWPWIKNYKGELQVGNTAQPNWVKWVWLDQNLKAQLQ